MQNTVLITGANGNLGQAVVKKFLDTGYKVIAIDGSDNNLSFAKKSPDFEWLSVNLASEAEASEKISQIINQYKQVHAALLLVGGFAMGKLQETDGALLNKMFTLNFNTAYFSSRPLFDHMMKMGTGRIVFVGARPALAPQDGKKMAAYALSKSLLFTLANLMNAEAKGKNVTTSLIVPSTIDTPANRESMPDANPENWVKAEEIAETLSFICSTAANPMREMVYKLYNNS
ncbi:MAG TPA: SDR family NAD(P)-dependent oxidoreductase [Flavitalea sp.]|nr:SDR family NAD(P)-dependent oxidoreductase [Flavitalea sp.]